MKTVQYIKRRFVAGLLYRIIDSIYLKKIDLMITYSCQLLFLEAILPFCRRSSQSGALHSPRCITLLLAAVCTGK